VSHSYARSSVRFADPWRFRNSTARIEPMADLHGRPVEYCAFFRRGGVPMLACAADVSGERSTERDISTTPAETGRQLRRRRSVMMARYRLHGRCTTIELNTIESLWIRHLSLRRLARLEGVTPAAIGARLRGLAPKAPEFYRWWRLRHHTRIQAVRKWRAQSGARGRPVTTSRPSRLEEL
jgi:hypothetical protein